MCGVKLSNLPSVDIVVLPLPFLVCCHSQGWVLARVHLSPHLCFQMLGDGNNGRWRLLVCPPCRWQNQQEEA